MTNEFIEFFADHPILAIMLLAMVFFFMLLYCVCAIAKEDDSCMPERNCLNCGHRRDFDYDTSCDACLATHPLFKLWTPESHE